MDSEIADQKEDETLQRKLQHYAELDQALDSDEDDIPDPGRLASIRIMEKAAMRQKSRRLSRSETAMLRSVSDTNLLQDKPALPAQKIPNLTRSSTADGNIDERVRTKPIDIMNDPAILKVPSSIPTSKVIGKRKRETTIRQVPIEQQIFQGLHFYFFPNSDKHPARKMRIAKAVEYGAIWDENFSEAVTHIILDKTIDFDSFKKFLKLDESPSGMIVVSENYPAECITFRTLLDPRQPQFKVKGYAANKGPGAASTASDRSLELKPAGRSVQARQPETPTKDQQALSPASQVTSRNDIDQVPPAEEVVTANPAIASNAEFDAAIEQARGMRDMPLDLDEEPVSRPTSSEGPVTDDEETGAGLKLVKQKSKKLQDRQGKFQCMHKHTGSDENANSATISVLQQMAEYYSQIGDEWRTRAYRKAISALRKHPTKVCTREEALAIPQIGDRIATKIEEIAVTNRLRRLDNAKAEPTDQIFQTFMQVYGVGPAQASKWVATGFTTLGELREKATLTDNQRIGIDHYVDFNSRIPRAEVEKHGRIVRDTLHKIDPAFQVIVGGSYRRGAQTSGDIDCIITRPDTGIQHIRAVVLDQLVPRLFKRGFLVAELAVTSRDDGSKWHGASCVRSAEDTKDPPWRRIDLLLVPSDELGAALIYFTGNDIFNRSIRLLAGSKGMRLNQRGLYKDVMRGRGREKLTEGTLVEGRDEKRIFEILGVPWRPPEHRIC